MFKHHINKIVLLKPTKLKILIKNMHDLNRQTDKI